MVRLSLKGWAGAPACWIPIALVLALLVSGCAGIFTNANVPVPETPRERLAVLEISYQAANRSIQDLVAAGTLHGEAAFRIENLLETAWAALHVARKGIDGPNGLDLLAVANRAVITLTARLRAEESS